MRNNFGKRYFMRIPFSFQEKLRKTAKSNQQKPPNCGSTRDGGKGFLPNKFFS